MKSKVFTVNLLDVPEESFFDENIVFLRKVKRLTQEELAKVIGIPRSRLGSYEERRADPDVATLVRIAKVLNVTIDQLVAKKLTMESLSEKEEEESAPLVMGDEFFRKIDLVKYLVSDLEVCAKAGLNNNK